MRYVKKLDEREEIYLKDELK